MNYSAYAQSAGSGGIVGLLLSYLLNITNAGLAHLGPLFVMPDDLKAAMIAAAAGWVVHSLASKPSAPVAALPAPTVTVDAKPTATP
jgi:hypothetical protein